MRAVLIDDERNALEALRDNLGLFEQVEIVAQFTNPLEALRQLEGGSCDIVFLDIEMPGLSGLETADKLADIVPRAAIVFVTAYEHYAVEAFELHALDYLLKPVRHARLAKTLERLQAVRPRRTEDSEGVKTFVQSFGTFELRQGPDGGGHVKWRTSKVRELLAYLVHHRGERLHRTRIIEELMPELAMEKALVYLHTCIYQIRKIVKDLGLEGQVGLKYSDQSYMLEWNDIYWDADLLRQAAKDFPDRAESAVSGMETAAALYHGGYLEHEDYLWAADARAELLLTYNVLAEKLAKHYTHRGMPGKAIQLLHRSLTRNPLHIAFHELLLTALAQAGDQQTLERHYEEMKEMFIRELGVGPGQSIERLYERLRL